MLILTFHQAQPSTPLFEICGLPLAVRGALDGIKNGYRNIYVLVHAADQQQVTQILQLYSRLCNVKAVSSRDEFLHELQRVTPLTEAQAITVVPGNNVWSGSFLPDLKSSASPDTSIITRHTCDTGSIGTLTKKELKDFAISLFAVSHGEITKKTLPARSVNPSAQPQSHTVQSQLDIPAAEDFLLSQLVKKADGIISRNINRKISLAITRRLMKTVVTPNQVTAVVLLIGILSGPAMIFMGGYSGLVTGGLLYYLAAILDGCDGELSRLKYMGTPYGTWLDTIVDDTVGLSYILGLYWYLANQATAWGWVGCAAVFFYLLTLGPRYYIMAVFLHSGDYQQLSAAKPRTLTPSLLTKALHIMEDTVCRTDFIPFAAFVTSIFNGPAIFAGTFLLGTMASASDSLYTFYRMKKIAQAQTVNKSL